MTAYDNDEEEVFKEQRIYMPFPGRFGRDKEMGRGPYEKSGLLRETSIPPGQKIHEVFELAFPFEKSEKDGKPWRELLKDELNIEVIVWYLPFGEFDGYEVAFYEEERKLELKSEWVWR